MSDEASVRLKCSNCGRVVVTLPQDYHMGGKSVCPGCGAEIEPPGVIGRIADDLKDALASVAGRRKKGK
jgi:DNA-directed RNA polymerase subunit RPC12/RpoP